MEVSPSILQSVLKKFNTNFKKNNELIKPEIGNKLDPTPIFQMSDEERNKMIDSINNTSSNKKLVNTFFNLNGRENCENESISDSLNINMEIDNISSTSSTSQDSNIEILNDIEL